MNETFHIIIDNIFHLLTRFKCMQYKDFQIYGYPIARHIGIFRAPFYDKFDILFDQIDILIGGDKQIFENSYDVSSVNKKKISIDEFLKVYCPAKNVPIFEILNIFMISII